MDKLVVLGAGSWGTALANMAADAGLNVTLWGRDEFQIMDMQRISENTKYLPGKKLHSSLQYSSNLSKALHDHTIIVSAIPTQSVRETLWPHREVFKNKILINSSKGIEIKTQKRLSEVFYELNPSLEYAVLSGPSFANEVMGMLPTAVTLASANLKTARAIQKKLTTPYFRTYTTTDVTGVEIAGALKNIMAIGSGIVAGLNLGNNAQAALINRGMVEMIRFARAFGGLDQTFMGLSGIGDLILTCTGGMSRNRKLGIALGQGIKIDEALHQVGGVAEGYYTSKAVMLMTKGKNISMPIAEHVYKIMFKKLSAKKALGALMNRSLTDEWI